MEKHLRIIATFCVATPLLARSPSANSPTSAATTPTQCRTTPSPAESIGMFAYPNKQRRVDQQLQDENECFASARQQSGIAFHARPPAAKTEEQEKPSSKQQWTMPSM